MESDDREKGGQSRPLGWPVGGGEMAARIRAHDWAATPLGPLATWPQRLTTAVDICLDAAFATFIWWGSDLVQLYNDAGRAVLRAKHPDALGRPARVAWSEVWPTVGPLVERVIESGQAVRGEDLAMVPDCGGPREETVFTLSYSPLRDAEGRIAGLFVTAVETTDRVRAEAARAEYERLRGSEARLRRALEIETVGVIFFRTTGEIIYANEAFLRMSGYTAGDQEQGLLRWDKITPPEYMPQSLAAMEEVTAYGRTTPYEKEYIRKDGSRGWALFAATRIDDATGAEYIIDITTHRRAEADLAVELEAMTRLHDLSQRVVSAPDLQTLLDTALEATIALHGADFGNIQLYDAQTRTLRIAAQRGFAPPFLEHFAQVSAEEGSACGIALARGERVIIPDVAQDPAYAPSLAAARVAGYRAVQSTPLLTATGGPLGMLSTHFRQPRRFAARELRLTDLYARLASEALAAQLLAQSLRERAVHEHAARVELRDALAEQRALLHEVNHRVKNNLEVINSLLSLQAADVQDVRAQQALAEAANRVRALGLVHRLLYEAPRIAQLDLGRFAEELAQALFASYGVAHDRVRFELSGERLGTDLQHAVPLGLIFNELFCNVLKHAFPGGRPGCIQLRIDAAGVLYLADDGIGLPTSVDVGHPRSLGLRLVQALVRQVGGTLQVVPGPGTRYRLQLPPAQEGGSSLSRRSRAS